MEHLAATGSAPLVRSAAGRDQRRLRNFLLDAPLQLRLASYLLAVGVALSLGLGFLLFRAYQETSRVIALGDPDGGDSIATALAREDRLRVVSIAVVLVAVLVCLVGSAVVVSHRIAGPAFAIARTCRQVAEGNLSRARPLRPRDLLVDLGKDVAAMVDALRARELHDREEMLEALAALRDPQRAADGRRAAVDALERLLREKEGRLGP
jgi:HAMP domain-containing protein